MVFEFRQYAKPGRISDKISQLTNARKTFIFFDCPHHIKDLHGKAKLPININVDLWLIKGPEIKLTLLKFVFSMCFSISTFGFIYTLICWLFIYFWFLFLFYCSIFILRYIFFVLFYFLYKCFLTNIDWIYLTSPKKLVYWKILCEFAFNWFCSFLC